MARRASSGVSPLWWVAILVLCALAVGGGKYLFDYFGDPYRTLQSLDAGVYLENANSLRGNVYKLRGTIEKSLGWHPSKGRMFSVKVEGEGETALLPILVPPSLNHINVQQGQQFNFQVEIAGGGVIVIHDMRKN